jgi:phage baseplate assembly protein W
MAFGAKKIFPIDQNPRKAVGVALPFNAPSTFDSTFTTKDAIRNNLINYLLTNPGERPLNPTFGAGIRNYIFNQLVDQNLEDIASKIESDIQKYFPSIQANVQVIPNYDYNTVFIDINYSIINTGINDNLQINFNNGQ